MEVYYDWGNWHIQSEPVITEPREINKDVKFTSVLVNHVAGTLGIFGKTS